MDPAVLERLSKPISKKEPSKEMMRDCTFFPKLCDKSLELTASRPKFHDRIPEVIAAHNKARESRLKQKPNHPFKPEITSMTPALSAKLEGRGDFLTRYKDDNENRKKKAVTNLETQVTRYPFKPAVTKSPKGIEVKGSFLERVATDLDARKTRQQPQIADPECKFQPELSKNTLKLLKGGPKFMSRMNADLEKRRDKIEEIKKELAKPPKFPKKKKK